MNLNRRRNKGGDSDDGMSSMTDLVFLMLIFFIILSTMVNPALPVNLPSGKSLPNTPQDPPVEVGVNSKSQYFLKESLTKFYSFEEIAPILERKISEQIIPSLKISGDQKADFDAVFKLIKLSKEKDWKPVLSYSK